jgi:hypothetical protein
MSIVALIRSELDELLPEFFKTTDEVGRRLVSSTEVTATTQNTSETEDTITVTITLKSRRYSVEDGMMSGYIDDLGSALTSLTRDTVSLIDELKMLFNPVYRNEEAADNAGVDLYRQELSLSNISYEIKVRQVSSGSSDMFVMIPYIVISMDILVFDLSSYDVGGKEYSKARYSYLCINNYSETELNEWAISLGISVDNKTREEICDEIKAEL